MSVSYDVVVTASVAVPGAILPVCAYDKIRLLCALQHNCTTCIAQLFIGIALLSPKFLSFVRWTMDVP